MADNTTTIQSFLNVFLTPIGNPTTAINTVMALFPSPNECCANVRTTLSLLTGKAYSQASLAMTTM